MTACTTGGAVVYNTGIGIGIGNGPIVACGITGCQVSGIHAAVAYTIAFAGAGQFRYDYWYVGRYRPWSIVGIDALNGI